MRIAYFPDSLYEVNGVARTSRQLISFAQKRSLPMLVVYAGANSGTRDEGSIRYVSVNRSFTAIKVDESLHYDPAFFRHYSFVRMEVEQFAPDVIHITGLNDVSNLGSFLAWKMRVAQVGSWHTNLHEYASRRFAHWLRFLPPDAKTRLLHKAESIILSGACLYFRMPQVFLAPNPELFETLTASTGKTGFLMNRGIDTEAFSPQFRSKDDETIRLGFVGRLRAEKNVRKLVEIESGLIKAGLKNFEFVIVGEGAEKSFLEANMRYAKFTGFLNGRKLSEAYANMDVFVFPSETDTYGNVIHEANASGVPCIVSDKGGPKYLIRNGETGFIVSTADDFVSRIRFLINNKDELREIREAAFRLAQTHSWDTVFETVYQAYANAKEILESRGD